MTARRPSAPDLLPDAAARREAASAGPLVDELYRGHALRLTRMALLLVGDRPSAEDVVQEAFYGSGPRPSGRSPDGIMEGLS